MQKERIGFWPLMALLMGGICYAATYSLPYIKGVFYGPMMQATGATNFQLGWIMSIYGFSNIILNSIGGIFADKWDYRKCIIFSLYGTGLLSIWLALVPSVTSLYIIWGLLGFTTIFVFSPAIFKLPRMVVPDSLIGQSVSLLAFGQAVGYIAINFSALYVYDLSASHSTPAEAFSNVVWTFAAFTIVSASLCPFIFRKLKDVKPSVEDSVEFQLSDVLLVIKQPGLWLMSICGFCLYTASMAASYFTPYFNDVFGITVTSSGIIGIFTLYGGRLFSPLLGTLATKTRYGSRLIVFGATFLVVIFLGIIFASHTVPFKFLLFMAFCTGCFATMFTNLCLALPPEAQIPRYASGTAMGIYAAVAYSPDLFIHSMFGYCLDKYGNDGYNMMFAFIVGLLSLCAVSAFILYRRCRKLDYAKRATSQA